MDDLTQIKGIGRATAERLAQAGLGSFAALAAADPAALAAHEALRGVRASPTDIQGWIAAAAAMAGAARTDGPTQAHDEGAGDGGVTGGDNAGAPPPATPALPDPAALAAGDVLVVTGPKRGRWRAGRHFGPAPVRLAVSDLSEADQDAIRADPMLTVVAD